MDLSNGTVLVVADFATMRGILASLLHEVDFGKTVQTVRRSPKHTKQTSSMQRSIDFHQHIRN
jgi:hypothetical protein